MLGAVPERRRGTALHQLLTPKQLGSDKQSDMIDAFVACGGDEDLGGCVRKETLISIIKEEFSLPIDIERLINEIDTDGSGEIEYEEMVELLGGA